MFFNSLDFAIFLPIVFVLYWFGTFKKLKLQNLLLLLASYYFYASWDFRFLFLLMASTLLDYFTGLKIFDSKQNKTRSFWLWLSIIINLGFLVFFKYYNFFVDSFAQLISSFGVSTSIWTLNIILPVGISFYTFHGLSYVFDIYRNKTKPTRNFIQYAVFVSFFPLLVAGPIERATHLLPQIQKKRKFEYLNAVDGLRQILWGLFKKIVIADNCAHYVDIIFNDYAKYSGSTLVLGVIFFAIQIYGDFSGYSDIALGTARLFGIELLQNFSFPYFSRDIAEFWRRWHISLSSWFKDYLYIPLGGSKGSIWMRVRNTFIIFLVSGFWHGANWTFIVWGALHAVYFLPLMLLRKNRTHLNIIAKGRFFPSFKEVIQIGLTFILTSFAWIFFRAETVSMALLYIRGIYSRSLLTLPEIAPIPILLLVILFLATEWLQREKQHALQIDSGVIPKMARWGIYFVIITLIFNYGGTSQQFIYFQF